MPDVARCPAILTTRDVGVASCRASTPGPRDSARPRKSWSTACLGPIRALRTVLDSSPSTRAGTYEWRRSIVLPALPECAGFFADQIGIRSAEIDQSDLSWQPAAFRCFDRAVWRNSAASVFANRSARPRTRSRGRITASVKFRTLVKWQWAPRPKGEAPTALLRMRRLQLPPSRPQPLRLFSTAQTRASCLLAPR